MLDSILGSKESVDEGDQRGPLPGPGTKSKRRRGRGSAAAKRVRPLYVYVIYYCYIVVYLAAAWLAATDGELAASALVDGLVNDHLAVAAGQVPRLATAGFVCEGPLMLFMQLATLATVGLEAEALLGYSLFWAVYWLASLGGALADAALSDLPVTFGPANAAAGIVGALVAYYARNWRLEERIEEAREAARAEAAGQLGVSGGGQLSSFSASRDSVEESEAEVELLPLIPLKLKAALSGEGRAVFNLLVATVVAGQGLLEFGGASSSASWIGLTGAFWTGLLLTFGAGPQYDVVLAGDAAEAEAEAGAGAGAKEGGKQQEEEAGDSDGLRVVDVAPLLRRQAVLGGYTAALAVIIFGWLAWMGVEARP